MTHQDLVALRRFYASEIQAVGNIQSTKLVDAFARVPREHYLGPGPWHIPDPKQILRTGDARAQYRLTPDDDPRHIYHNVLVGIDPDHSLNNGEPASLAMWFDQLDVQLGMDVLHVGCGVGYYTAILAEVVGTQGHVTGIEVNEDLAKRAKNNLRGLPNTEVICGDATKLTLGSFDRIFINAGATHLPVCWITALNDKGRMIFPLTAGEGGGSSAGLMLLVENLAPLWRAQFISHVMVFDCVGARDRAMSERLQDFLNRGEWTNVRSLRRESHNPDETCCLHAQDFCLSSKQET